MGYICPKNTFLQLKHIQGIYLTLLLTTCVKIPQTPYNIFYDTTRLYYCSSNITYFDKKIPSECKFSDFPLPELKFIKFLMSFFKQKVSFSSKCGSLLSVMRDNSSVLFHLKLYILSTKGTHQVHIFRLSTARIKINQIPCHFSSHESVFP